MPAICLVSTRAEREAAGIYYGENHFVFGLTKSGRDSRVLTFAAETWTRHLRLIRQVTYQCADPYSWVGPGFGFAGESFTEISRFKNLEELNIRVDENAMIRRMLVSRRHVQCSPRRPMTLQDGVALLRHPGMNGLLKMSGIPAVNFVKAFDDSGTEVGGPIPGGYLESVIRPRLEAAKERVTRTRYCRTIQFPVLVASLLTFFTVSKACSISYPFHRSCATVSTHCFSHSMAQPIRRPSLQAPNARDVVETLHQIMAPVSTSSLRTTAFMTKRTASSTTRTRLSSTTRSSCTHSFSISVISVFP